MEIARWRYDKGDSTLRLNYPIDENSIIFDLGAYKGEWGEKINKKNGSTVFLFEPVKAFYEDIRRRFKNNPSMKVFHFGLSSKNETINVHVDADRSSSFSVGKEGENCELRKIDDFLNENKIEHVHLMKINIEGGEYELLEHMMETGIISKIDDVQVQFHDFVENSHERRKKIQEKLSLSHYQTYNYDFIWENWRLDNSHH